MVMLKYFFKGEYRFKARFIPAVITALPFFILFWMLFVREDPILMVKLRSFLDQNTPSYGKWALLLVVTWVWAQIVRLSSKLIEEVVFNHELNFPTTNLLLWSNDDLPRSVKTSVHKSLRLEFDVKLLDEAEEMRCEVEARKLIAIAVKKMRDKMRDGRIILQYNILYGFVRNTTIGSVYSFLASLIVLYAGALEGVNSMTFCVGVFLSGFYLLAIMCAKPLWTYTGGLYARTLINEYLGGPRPSA